MPFFTSSRLRNSPANTSGSAPWLKPDRCAAFAVILFMLHLPAPAALPDSSAIPLADSGSAGDFTNIRLGERPYIDVAKVPREAMIPGVINVKFRPAMTGHLDATPMTHGTDGSIRFGIPLFDTLNRKFRVKKSGLVFSRKNSRVDFSKRHRSWGLHLWHTLEADTAADVRQIVAEYQKLPEVELAEPLYRKRLLWTPNDPRFNEQWHYHNTGQAGGTAGCDIRLPEAWEIAKGDSNVIVAVVDGGIQYDHPDLAANMWRGRGYNFVDHSPAIAPEAHGTHVAGTIAAGSNNSAGVAGIAGGSGAGGGVRLMSCQVFSGLSSGGFAQAYIYAADSGAAISQNSWGYTAKGVYEQEVLDAIDYFNVNGGGSVLGGGITVFAAGNDTASGPWYPGCYTGVVAVAATNNSDVLTYYSNYDTWVDISAPGGELNSLSSRGVLSTSAGGAYQFMSGTSMACPHVSGAAALVISYAPGKLSPADVKNILISSVDTIDAKNPGFAGKIGSGRLNAYKALLATQPYLLRLSNPAAFDAGAQGPDRIDLSWQKNASNDNVMVAWSSTPSFGTPAPGTAYSAGLAIPGGGQVIFNGDSTAWSHSGLSAVTTYFYKAWSVDASNNYSVGKTASETTLHTPAVSRSLSISVPGPGHILIEADGYFLFQSASWTTARASLSLGSGVDDRFVCVTSGNYNYNRYGGFAVSRALEVTSAGTYKAYLTGDILEGSSVKMLKNNVSAIYIPY
jgi:hypothetical protein